MRISDWSSDVCSSDLIMNHSTTEVFFDNVRVPASSLIGEEGKGFRYILSGMNAERILIGAECIGDAKWFIGKASAYAQERSLFGKPIGTNQRSEEHTSELQSLMRISYAVFCLKKKKNN